MIAALSARLISIRDAVSIQADPADLPSPPSKASASSSASTVPRRDVLFDTRVDALTRLAVDAVETTANQPSVVKPSSRRTSVNIGRSLTRARIFFAEADACSLASCASHQPAVAMARISVAVSASAQATAAADDVSEVEAMEAEKNQDAARVLALGAWHDATLAIVQCLRQRSHKEGDEGGANLQRACAILRKKLAALYSHFVLRGRPEPAAHAAKLLAALASAALMPGACDDGMSGIEPSSSSLTLMSSKAAALALADASLAYSEAAAPHLAQRYADAAKLATADDLGFNDKGAVCASLEAVAIAVAHATSVTGTSEAGHADKCSRELLALTELTVPSTGGIVDGNEDSRCGLEGDDDDPLGRGARRALAASALFARHGNGDQALLSARRAALLLTHAATGSSTVDKGSAAAQPLVTVPWRQVVAACEANSTLGALWATRGAAWHAAEYYSRAARSAASMGSARARHDITLG